MRGNSFGKMFSMTSFGESHGPALGVVLDGVPAGLDFSLENLSKELKRRAPGQSVGTTSRKEDDLPEMLSGIFEGKTLGTPIAVIVRNTNQRSGDYQTINNEFRPGHADKTTLQKFGIRDHRGGGRSSGRETISRVIAGYFASLVIKNVSVHAFLTELGPFKFDGIPAAIGDDFSPYYFPIKSKAPEIESYLLELKKNGESRGGRALIVARGVCPGLGEPCFDKLKADLAKAIMSIGAVVSFGYGLGEKMANIDGTVASSDKKNFGGIEGGISNGDDIILNVVFKPTSTIGDKAKKGRHDPCIIPRAIPVLEAMVKTVLADHYLRQQAYGD